MPYGRITGWAVDLPEKVLTNADLASMVDTSDEWITERSGISSRHVDGTVTEMSTVAGRAALAMAGVSPNQVDLLLLATTTSDQMIPASSSVVQDNLGLSCGAVDLNAACSGFVYGLVTAMQFVEGGMERVLLIGSDALSRFTNWEDRTTCVLFGDGAGAVVIERNGSQPSLLGWDLMSDGSAADLLYCEHDDKIVMHGQEVFRKAVLAMEKAATTATCTSSPSSSSVATSIDHVCSTNASKPGAEGSVTASRVSPPSLSSTVDSTSTRSTPAQTRATTRKAGNPHRHAAGRGGARRRRSSFDGVSPSTGSVTARPRRGRAQR